MNEHAKKHGSLKNPEQTHQKLINAISGRQRNINNNITILGERGIN